MSRDANCATKLNAPDYVQMATRLGARLRPRLQTMTPAERAAVFRQIDAARIALAVTETRLCAEARVSRRHYVNLVAQNGEKATARCLLQLLRALRSVRAMLRNGEYYDNPVVLRAAYRGCLSAAHQTLPCDLSLEEIDTYLSRRGEFPANANWRAATRLRAVAMYLASTELGAKGTQLAALTGLTPAAVSIALGKIEAARDDAQFDAGLERAAALVRNER